jgi:hypothetical protein
LVDDAIALRVGQVTERLAEHRHVVGHPGE